MYLLNQKQRNYQIVYNIVKSVKQINKSIDYSNTMSKTRLKTAIQVASSQPFSLLRQFISRHPYSCYMLAAIEYNNALFHIFSGPLFANVQGYVYLDLIIWGISPLIYLLFRPTLYKMIKPDIPTDKIANINQPTKLIKQIQKHKHHLTFIHNRRLSFLITFSIAIFISFLFMNYSQTFNWNYFTRIINMDLGYLIFDFACRSMQLIVEIEEDEEIQEKYIRCKTEYQLEEMRETAIKVEKCRIYCKFKNLAMFLSYSVVFLLFTNGFDVNIRYSGQQVLACTSIISCLVTFVIPVLYYFHFKKKYFQKWNKLGEKLEYKKLEEQERQENNNNEVEINDYVIQDEVGDGQAQEEVQNQLRRIKRIICKANNPCSPPTHNNQNLSGEGTGKKSRLQTIRLIFSSTQLFRGMTIFILVFFSAIINISYLALWIMQTLKHEQNYIQYNQTLLISAVFLMMGAVLFGIASRMNLTQPFEIGGSRMKTDESSTNNKSTQLGYYTNKCLLLIFGVLLLLSFNLIRANIYTFILSTIGLGFHLSLLNYLYFKVEKIIQQVDQLLQINLDILSLHLQIKKTIAYLVVPVVITIMQMTDYTYAIYGYLSSVAMIVAAVIL